MAILTLGQAIEVLANAEDDHPLYEGAVTAIEGVMGGIKNSQSLLIEMMVNGGAEVKVNHEGEMVMEVGDTEVVL
jgi:hypothetical protein